MPVLPWGRWVKLCIILLVLGGCAPRAYIQPYPAEYYPPPPAPPSSPSPSTDGSLKHLQKESRPAPASRAWTYRAITEKELIGLSKKDPELTTVRAYDILANLNARARYYVREDVANRRPLKVPNNFSAYKNWSPLPRYIPDLTQVQKFILITKDTPYLAWYEYGRMKGDTFVCIGREEGWTEEGFYKVLTKDADHVSKSYPNAYGEPAPMPWALRIYDHVWIHLGDITGGNCSHGCINLPLGKAEQLYQWADYDTIVVVVDTLPRLQGILKKNSRQLVPDSGRKKDQDMFPTSDR